MITNAPAHLPPGQTTLTSQPSTQQHHDPHPVHHNQAANFLSCHTAHHNINGIKGDTLKLLALVDKLKDKHIIGLIETNLDKAGGAALNHDLYNQFALKGIWSTRDNKIKGSGVALLINAAWEKHISKIIHHGHYMIQLLLQFKGANLHIFQIYLPPGNQDTCKSLQETIAKHIKSLKNKYH